MKPYVEEFDDISSIHQEIEGYTHCIRAVFEEPFFEVSLENYDEETGSDHYEVLQHMYEREACVAVFGDLQPKDILFDWHDEQELWIRYNIGESEPTFEEPSVERLRWLCSVIVATELQDFNLRELASFLVSGVSYLETFDDCQEQLDVHLIEESEDEGYVVFIGFENIVFNYPEEALAWILRNIDLIEKRFKVS